jgi:hypothetical protein
MSKPIEQRYKCADNYGGGIPRLLVDMLEANAASNPRYGPRGRQVADADELVSAAHRRGVGTGALWEGMRLAGALDLDDPFVGEDITFLPGQHHFDGGVETVLLPTLMPAAYIKTALRTGLFLLDRSVVDTTGERSRWSATASGWQRADPGSSTWLAVAETAYWRHRYERAADGRTPTAAWESEGDIMLIAAAEVLCAHRAMGGLFARIPCVALAMAIDEDADYQDLRAKAFQRERDIMEAVRANGVLPG